MPPLISEEATDEMSSGDDSDAEHISMDMLEDIRDVSQSRLIVNRRELRYKICDDVK